MRITMATVAVAASQLLLFVPAAHAQRPDRPSPERSVRRDSLPRAELRVERWPDSSSACRCSILAAPSGEDMVRRLHEFGEMGAARGALLRGLRDVDSLGRSERLSVWTLPRVAGSVPGSLFGALSVEPRGDRAMLGIAVGEAQPGGLAVVRVTAGGPADSAGIRVGDRLTAIDGTSLRLAPADSGDARLSGVVARRLTRMLDTLDAGDTVSLGVVGRDGAERTVRVATARADALPATAGALASVGRLESIAGAARGGAAIGLTARATFTPRDTLGVFVAAVAAGGRADRAGIHEGMRIAAVNGIDLRVNPADVGDRAASSARAAQLARALDAAREGEQVTFRVLDGATQREVTVQR